MMINVKWNRKQAAGLAGLLVAAVVGSGLGYRTIAAGAAENEGENVQTAAPEKDADAESKRLVWEGTTQIQTENQTPVFAVDAVTMTVEEVYVTAGMTVTEGERLFKLTDESVKEALAYYEEAVTEAEEELEGAKLEFQSGVLEAEYQLADTQLEAENAQSAYDASASELWIKVEEKKQEYEETIEELQGYETAVSSGTYYLQAGIDEKQNEITMAQTAAAAAQEQLAAAQSTYDMTQMAIAADLETLKEQIATNTSQEELQILAEQITKDYTAVQTATSGLTQAQMTADTAQSTLEKANQSLESAVKEYNTNLTTANERIAELYEKAAEQQKNYEQAERDATTAMTGLKKEYEEAVLAGKYAGTEYESALAELEQAVERAEDGLNALTEEQTTLLELEDGVVCADRTGTLAAISYEAEDVLKSGVSFVSYCDTETIFISVEVPQEEIAWLTVGDEVTVAVTGSKETMCGRIASIAASATTGGSISNVTYAVVVTIDNEEGTLSSGLQALVTFELGEAKK